MAVPAGVKLDDGSSHFATNSFPVRHIFGASDSAGAWLVAHRTEQIRQLTEPKAEPKTYAQLKYERKQREKNERREKDGGGSVKTEEEESATPGVLDGFLLLKHCCVDDPSDLCSVNVAGQDLTDAKPEDFELFANVAYVNAGENLLPFAAFNHFPIIRELELPLNGLRGLQVSYDQFPFLEVLDLSHNNLSKEDVSNLGLLTSLKVLYLTGNQLRSLPSEMAKPFKVQMSDNESSRIPRFSKLEILHLDDNALHDLAIFASLAGIRKLRQLNLDHNEIASVPHLKALSGHLIAVDSRTESPSSTTPRGKGGRPRSARSKKKGGSRKGEQDQEGRSESSEQGKGTISDAPSLLLADIEEEGDLMDVSNVLGDLEKLPPPFPELTSLSLAYNKIADEESLLAVAAWPMLQELVIHNNPLTTQNSGDPPLLKRFLSDRLGINMVRKKPSANPKPPVKVPNKPHRKVAEIVPPIPKKPLQLMLEASSTTPDPRQQPLPASTSHTPPEPKGGSVPLTVEDLTRPSSQPLPPINHSQARDTGDADDADDDDGDHQEQRFERTKSWTEQSFGGSDEEEEFKRETSREKKPKDKVADEPVFLTQVDEHPEDEISQPQQPQPVPKPPSDARPSEIKSRSRKPRVDSAAYSISVPQKFKGYEIFYDAPDDPEVYTAPDIQSNLRSLKLALRHGTTYGENKVELQRVQKPFKPYQKPKFPDKPPHKDKAERLADILDDMKNRDTYVESNLADILADRDKMREFPQVTKLLEEIQNKYSKVRKASEKGKRDDEAAVAAMIDDLDQIDRKLTAASPTKPNSQSRTAVSRQQEAK